jgi:serine/threonine-protein kinase
MFLVAFPIYQRLTQQDLKLPSKVFLAILPFETINLTGDSMAFAKGLIATLNAQLTKLTGHHPLQVVSASEIRDKNIQNVEEAYREFGANLVMEGSLQQVGELMRIDYVMVNAKTNEQLRGDTITAAISNSFSLMDSVVASVLSNLEVALLPEEERSISIRTTQQPEAYNNYVTAIGYLQDYHKSEYVQSAIRILQSALEQDPEFAEAYAALGESLLLQYRYYEKETKHVEEALSACTRALELDSHLASGHVCLGNVFTGMGKYEEAVKEFRRALELEPANDEACRGLGSAYEDLGLYNEAEKIYKSAIELKPEYWAGYNDLGRLYVRQGRFSEAAEQYAQLTKLVPNHHIGYSNLGGVYLYEGRYSEAIPILEHSVALRDTEVAYSNLGTAYFYLRRFSKAADAYEKAIGLNERYWTLWGNLGDARYWDPTNRDRAGEAYRKALILGEQELQVNPRDARLLSCMAYYHAMLDEKEAAQKCMKLALAEDPQDPELFFNLAQTCCRLGDADQARDWLKKAMTAGLSNESIQNTPLFDHLRNSQEFQDMLGDN